MFRSISEKFGVKTSQTKPAARSRRNVSGKTNQSGAQKKPPTAAPASTRPIHLKVDTLFFLSVVSLIVFGLIVVWSASYDFSKLIFDDSMHIFYRQLLVLAIGLVGMVFLAFFDYHRIKDYALPAMIIVIVSLLLVLAFGDLRLGAKRTLLRGSLQPSEMAKMVMIVYLAVWLSSKKEKINKITFGLIPMAVILGIVSSLILLQPDLSAIFTIIFIGVVMFVLAGGDLRQIALLLVLAGVLGWLAMVLYPTGAQRINEFVVGLLDPTKGSDHVRLSFSAFINGGWFGVGLGNSEAKLVSLPVPHTDSVFAVVGEEFGMLGSLGLVGLFTLFLWRGLIISRRAPDQMGALLAAGLTIWIAFEAFVNMAGMVNVMPFPGNALPFTSAGGSNLFVSLLAVGFILNVSRQSVETENKEGKIFGDVIDLRRRNRRGSVPRARRSAGVRRDR